MTYLFYDNQFQILNKIRHIVFSLLFLNEIEEDFENETTGTVALDFAFGIFVVFTPYIIY